MQKEQPENVIFTLNELYKMEKYIILSSIVSLIKYNNYFGTRNL